jgi:hypothetical protein
MRTLLLIAALALTACGGSEDASLGGTLGGLPSNTSVTLQNNGASNLTLGANGSFWFSGTLSPGSAYSVTVLAQPVGASCSVSNATGTIDSVGSDVDDVVVSCTSTASITGTVSGLASGTSVTLANGSLSLAVAGNGAFAFPGVLAAGTAYNVVVTTQPAGQSCTVTNGSGTVVSGTATAVVVSCA